MQVGNLYRMNESYKTYYVDESDLFLLLGIDEIPNAVRKDHPVYYRYTFRNINTGEPFVINHADSVFEPLDNLVTNDIAETTLNNTLNRTEQ